MDTNNETPASESTTVQSGANGSPAAASTPSFKAARDEKTLDAISTGLAGVFGDEGPADEKPAAETEQADAETETEETEETPAAEQEAKPEGTDEQEEEEATEGDDDANKPGAAATATKPGKGTDANAPTLPAAFRRSLKAYEWTDAEIDANLKAYGPKFIETASKIHGNRNAEIAQWAAAGRNAIAAQQPEQQQQQQRQSTQATTALKPVDVAKLKEKYGDDETMIEDIAGPVNQAIEQINRMLPQIQQTQQRSQQSELDMLEKQVGSFFGGKELEPYLKVYGDPKSGRLTPENIAARNKVLETANALTVGAKTQFRDLSLGEALQMAHDAVSGEFKEQAVRTTIKKELKQRTKSITLKPTARGKDGQFKGGDAKTARERAVAAGLKAAFG